MNLHYYYWYFPSVIPHRICDDIIKYGKSQQEEIALTGAFNNKKKLDKEDLKNLKRVKKLKVKKTRLLNLNQMNYIQVLLVQTKKQE